MAWGQGQPRWSEIGVREVSWRRMEGAQLASYVLRLPLWRTESWSRSDSLLPLLAWLQAQPEGLLGLLASRWPCRE